MSLLYKKDTNQTNNNILLISALIKHQKYQNKKTVFQKKFSQMIRSFQNRYLFIERFNPSSATEYFTGNFDGLDHVFPKWMYFGKDHYV